MPSRSGLISAVRSDPFVVSAIPSIPALFSHPGVEMQ
jgi:hypothetical protein